MVIRKKERISPRVDTELKRNFDLIAKYRGILPSELARECLEKFVEKELKKIDISKTPAIR
jgi:predicted transcriptional regulator